MHSKNTQQPWVLSAYEWMSTLVISLLVMVVLFTFLFRVVRVDGSSMNTTLADGEQLLVLSAAKDYQRGDIVVVDRYTVEPLIKRVIAVGGDTIEIRIDSTVRVNGQLIYEPYAVGMTLPKDAEGVIQVPEGYVFAMGDNREVSLDSRAQQIGLIYEKDIIGKAVWRLTPLSSFGSIYDNMEHNAGG